MAEAISITIDSKEAIKALENFAKSIEGDMKTANKEISQEVANKASALAPKRTGALASSIVAFADTTKAQVSSAIPYAGVIEYGWNDRNIEAQPYLRPAVNQTMGFIEQSYSKEIDDKIKKYNLN